MSLLSLKGLTVVLHFISSLGTFLLESTVGELWGHPLLITPCFSPHGSRKAYLLIEKKDGDVFVFLNVPLV